MSTVRGPGVARDHPRALTAVLTVVGYVVVIGTLYGDVGQIGRASCRERVCLYV